MIKALLVIMTMTGSEYNVNMPDMQTCMEQAMAAAAFERLANQLPGSRIDH